MKNLKKSIISIGLLSILLFSIAAYFSPIANADPIGIGKYVYLKVADGEGSITLTKVSSGETWNTNSELEIKVGAGLVKLSIGETPYNYIFDYWVIDEGEPNYDPSPEFRTRKGTIVVEVYFKEINYYLVTASVSDLAPNGIITLGTTVITAEEPYSALVLEGTELTFEFTADLDNHISSITLNGAYQPPESLTIIVDQPYDVVAFFSEDGYAFVPAGANVEVYFTESASLYFENAIEQVAGGIELIRPWGYFVWDINAVIDAFTGEIVITLKIDLGDPIPETFEVLSFTFDNDDEENAFYCDVNGDLIVTAADLSLVANYNRLTNKHPQRYPYDPTYDTNRDGEITSDDIQLVQDYFGVPIEYEPANWDYDPATQTLTIYPDHFSIFRGR